MGFDQQINFENCMQTCFGVTIDVQQKYPCYNNHQSKVEFLGKSSEKIFDK